MKNSGLKLNQKHKERRQKQIFSIFECSEQKTLLFMSQSLTMLKWLRSELLAHLAKIHKKIIIDQKINIYLINKKNNEHQFAQGAEAHAEGN